MIEVNPPLIPIPNEMAHVGTNSDVVTGLSAGQRNGFAAMDNYVREIVAY